MVTVADLTALDAKITAVQTDLKDGYRSAGQEG